MDESQRLADSILVTLIHGHRLSSAAYRKTIESQQQIIDALERESQRLKEELMFAMRSLRNLSLHPTEWGKYNQEQQPEEPQDNEE